MSCESDPAGGTTVPPALAIENVVKTFGGLRALDGTTFDVPDGSITGILGPNGAGKTTLFNCISGTSSIDTGSIRLGGQPIQDRSAPARTDAGIGRTFQTPRVFGGMTVMENLQFSAPNQQGESVLGALGRPGAVAREEAAVTERAGEILALLEIESLADEFARGLSGGQRKLLELGRVLMLEPSVLLLDEPAAGVNPALTDRLLERLHEINADGRTIVLIEHDVGLVMDTCDHVVVMHQGRTLATGPPETIQADERVLEVYLGGD